MSNLTIGFIGLGLIGGSIAKAIKKIHPQYRIIASARSADTLSFALENKIIDEACDISGEAYASCDYIFLCAPVYYNTAYLKMLKPHIKSSCIITDVGSVKTSIHEEATRVGLNGQFIGGHPMAGSEKTGIQNASDRLLENAYYVITPSAEVSLDAVEQYKKLAEEIGAIPIVLDYKKHDYITAAISHVPHIIAAELVNLIHDSDDEKEHMKMIAAGGFKDITRIASSSPVMWQQICLSNSSNIASILEVYIAHLINVKNAISQSKEQELYNLFETARDYRDAIPSTSSGPLKKQYSIYCDIPDVTGIIATIATLLATNQISIKNIGIVHNREFEEGALRIEFYAEEASKTAAELLKKHHYTIYTR